MHAEANAWRDCREAVYLKTLKKIAAPQSIVASVATMAHSGRLSLSRFFGIVPSCYLACIPAVMGGLSFAGILQKLALENFRMLRPHQSRCRLRVPEQLEESNRQPVETRRIPQ
jgi:hypothetical protein